MHPDCKQGTILFKHKMLTIGLVMNVWNVLLTFGKNIKQVCCWWAEHSLFILKKSFFKFANGFTDRFAWRNTQNPWSSETKMADNVWQLVSRSVNEVNPLAAVQQTTLNENSRRTRDKQQQQPLETTEGRGQRRRRGSSWISRTVGIVKLVVDVLFNGMYALRSADYRVTIDARPIKHDFVYCNLLPSPGVNRIFTRPTTSRNRLHGCVSFNDLRMVGNMSKGNDVVPLVMIAACTIIIFAVPFHATVAYVTAYVRCTFHNTHRLYNIHIDLSVKRGSGSLSSTDLYFKAVEICCVAYGQLWENFFAVAFSRTNNFKLRNERSAKFFAFHYGKFSTGNRVIRFYQSITYWRANLFQRSAALPHRIQPGSHHENSTVYPSMKTTFSCEIKVWIPAKLFFSIWNTKDQIATNESKLAFSFPFDTIFVNVIFHFVRKSPFRYERTRSLRKYCIDGVACNLHSRWVTGLRWNTAMS